MEIYSSECLSCTQVFEWFKTYNPLAASGDQFLNATSLPHCFAFKAKYTILKICTKMTQNSRWLHKIHTANNTLKIIKKYYGIVTAATFF